MDRRVYVVELRRTEAPAVATLLRETDKSYFFDDNCATKVTGEWLRLYVGPRSSKNVFIACDTLAEAWTYVLQERTKRVKNVEAELAQAQRDAHEALLALEAAQKAGE